MDEKTTLTPDERMDVIRLRVQDTGKLDPDITIRLDGKDWTLRYTNRAIKGILSDTGFNLLSVRLTTEDMANPETLGSLMFHGLRSRHPELTPEAVDEMLTVRHTLYIQAQVARALGLFFPDVADMPLADDTRPEAGSEDPTQPPTDSGSATGRLAEVSVSVSPSSGGAVTGTLPPSTVLSN